MPTNSVATVGEAEPEEADGKQDEIRAKDEQREERHENNHLGNEHPLAPKNIGQAAKQHGAEQNAGETRSADDAFVGRKDMKLAGDERQGDAGHEDDEALEKFPCCGERPDAPLHAGHGSGFQPGPVGPSGQFVDIFLDRFGRGRGGGLRRYCSLSSCP